MDRLISSGAIDSWRALFSLLAQVFLIIIRALFDTATNGGPGAPATPGRPSPGASTGRFIHPTNGVGTTSQEFGRTGFADQSGWYGPAGHTGIDIAAPGGTPIVASDGGTVAAAGLAGGYGYRVMIDHAEGFRTLYGHMRDRPPVSAGQGVSKGDQIGVVGSTGLSSGNHLHFEILQNGDYKNPRNYVEFD